MTELWLDTEFSRFGGSLISMALVGRDATQWYRALPLPDDVDPWVMEHVVPKIGIKPSDPAEFRASLCTFLAARPGVTMYADWPADFVYLLNTMLGRSFDRSFMVPLRLELLNGSDPKPMVPHNALSDAIALRDWHLLQRVSR